MSHKVADLMCNCGQASVNVFRVVTSTLTISKLFYCLISVNGLGGLGLKLCVIKEEHLPYF